MSTETSEFLAFGLVAIVAGLFLLANLVLELAPAIQRKWILGIALGSGIFVLSFKIILTATFSTFSSQILEMTPTREYERYSDTNITELQTFSDSISQKTGYTWEALPNIAPSPKDNPITPEKIALGKKLFNDVRLSADSSLSCASCHELSTEKGGGDGLPRSIGISGQKGTRNAPTVLNAAFQRILFWDGRSHSLEDQARGPLTNPVEMGMPSLEAVQKRVRDTKEYEPAFSKAFTSEPSITIENITRAIAAYERTLITPDSPYDRFIQGDVNALSENQLRGMALFESTGCVICHSGPNFSGASIFGNNAMFRAFPATPDTEYESQYSLSDDLGAAQNSSGSKRGVWRIPSLRNVSRTAPYFHNGSVKNLEEAVRVMARIQLNKKLSNNTNDDKIIHWSNTQKQLSVSNNQALSDEEIKDIVAFLKALDGEIPEQ